MKERGSPLLKRADRYLGIPLVFLSGLIQKKRNWSAPPVGKKLRVLFLKTGAVGDSILLSAIALEIKKKWPKAHISLLCTRANSGIIPVLAGIDSAIVFDLSHSYASFKKLGQYDPFDLLIDFAAWPRLNSLIAFRVRADYRLGFRRRKQYRHYIYDKSVVHKDSLHELDNYRNLLHALGVENTGITPRIRTQEVERKFAKNARLNGLLSQYKKPVIFHPFPGGTKREFKMWPDKNWVLLGKRLLAQGFSIWLTGAHDEQSHARHIVQAIQKGLQPKLKSAVLNLSGQLDWAETVWLLQKAQMLVSVNTGIMHLAAAIGTRVIALNGPTSVARWGAIGKQVLNFRSTYECSPCLSLGFEYACKAGGCMTRIKANDVMRAAAKA